VKDEHEFYKTDDVEWTDAGAGITQRVLSQDPVDGTLTRLARWAPGTIPHGPYRTTTAA
jgi:hypothetical protein